MKAQSRVEWGGLAEENRKKNTSKLKLKNGALHFIGIILEVPIN